MIWLLGVGGARVILNKMSDTESAHGGVESVFVNLEGLGRVLHPARWLQVFALRQHGTRRVVSFFHLIVRRLEPVVFRRDYLRVLEVWDVGDPVVPRSTTR